MTSQSVVLRSGGRKLVGVLNLPARRRAPGVLFLHGFPGAEKSVDVQRLLLERGAASLQLHFSGAWGSGGLYRFSRLVGDARAGLRLLAGRPEVDARRLGVFGFSMGGWAAIHLAARERVRAAVAVAPVGGPEMVTPFTRARIAALAEPLSAGSVDALYRDFVSSVRRLDPARSAARLEAPLLLIHGDRDRTVPPAVSERLRAAAAGPCRLIRARGAEHSFLDRRRWLARTVSRWLLERL